MIRAHRAVGLWIAVLVLPGLVACERARDEARERSAAAATSAASSTPAAAAAGAGRIELRAGGLAPPGTAADRYWQEFAARLRDRSGSRVAPVLLTHGEVGSDEQILQALRRNRIQVAVNGAHAISGVVPDFAVLELPYLFESDDEAEYVAREHLLPELGPRLAQQGLRLLRLIPMGFHNVYARRPVRTPADLRGLRVRQPADVASTAYARALRLDLAPLPSNEIVTALQTGLIQAGTTVTLNYLWSGIAGDAPFLVLTRHAYLFNAVLANDAWWQSLSAADRALIDTSFGSARDYVALMRAAEQHDLDAAVARRETTLVSLTATELAQWQAPAGRVRAETAAAIGPGAVALLEACLAGKRAWAARDPLTPPAAPRHNP